MDVGIWLGASVVLVAPCVFFPELRACVRRCRRKSDDGDMDPDHAMKLSDGMYVVAVWQRVL